jgi:hypothetical protein
LKKRGKKDKTVPPMKLDFDVYETAFNEWCLYNLPPGREESECLQKCKALTYFDDLGTLRKSASVAKAEFTSLSTHLQTLEEDLAWLQTLVKRTEEDLRKPKVESSSSVKDDKRDRHSKSKVAPKALPETSKQPTKKNYTRSTTDTGKKASDGSHHTKPEKRSTGGSATKSTKADRSKTPDKKADGRRT